MVRLLHRQWLLQAVFYPYLEGYLNLTFSLEFCPGFTKGKRTAFAAHLHLPHEKYPHTNEQQHGKPGNKDGQIPRGLLWLLNRYVNSRRSEHGNKFSIVWSHSGKWTPIHARASDFLTLNIDLVYGTAVDA